MAQNRPVRPTRSPTGGITPFNLAVILSIVSGLCACATHEPLRLYDGALRPASETAGVYAPPVVACPEIRSVDGMQIGPRRQARLLPGVRTFDVICKKIQPRDPLGGWSGHQLIRLPTAPCHRARSEADVD